MNRQSKWRLTAVRLRRLRLNNMSEIITTYEIREPNIPIPMERIKFYEEQVKTFKKTGRPSRTVEIVHVLLFTPEGEILLQKRAPSKHHNPNLIDKSMGGHITFGDAPFYTVMVETVQELQVPSIVLYNEADFKKTYKLLRNYLESIAIIKQIDSKIVVFERIINKQKVKISHKAHFFLGVYGGSTKPVDRESSGVLYYSLKMLGKEMKYHPDNFTNDLLYYLKNYKNEIGKIMKLLKVEI